MVELLFCKQRVVSSNLTVGWTNNSVGRVFALQARGHWFESNFVQPGL